MFTVNVIHFVPNSINEIIFDLKREQYVLNITDLLCLKFGGVELNIKRDYQHSK